VSFAAITLCVTSQRVFVVVVVFVSLSTQSGNVLIRPHKLLSLYYVKKGHTNRAGQPCHKQERNFSQKLPNQGSM